MNVTGIVDTTGTYALKGLSIVTNTTVTGDQVVITAPQNIIKYVLLGVILIIMWKIFMR